MEAKTAYLYADTIQLAIAEIEAGVTNHTTTPHANKESAETETVLKGIPKPTNIFQNIIPVVLKISVPMPALLAEVMLSNILWKVKSNFSKKK